MSMACKDIDHIRSLSMPSVSRSSRLNGTRSCSSLDARLDGMESCSSLDTISDDEMEVFNPAQSSSAKTLLQKEYTNCKEDWKNKKDVKQCPSCEKSLSLFQSKHHCRSCGGVFCYDCTRFRRRLSSQRELHPEGRRYKVCIICDKEFSKISNEGQTRSRTKQFRVFSMESRPGNTTSKDIIGRLSADADNEGILKCTSVRQHLFDVHQDDIAKSIAEKLQKGMKAGIKATRGNLFFFFKTTMKDEKKSDEPALCFDCKTNLNIEGLRKVCKVCTMTFCIDCCEKDVVVRSEKSQKCDKTEPDIIIGNKKSTEYVKLKLKKGCYRVCRFCKSQYMNEMFLRDVSKIARHLIQLQKKITTADNDSKELPKLCMEYRGSFGDLRNIKAHSQTQTRLKQNVEKAMRDFYFEQLVGVSRRNTKHTKESSDYDLFDDTEETKNASPETEYPKKYHRTGSFFDMRAFFRIFKPQENARDYMPKVYSKANFEEKEVLETSLEREPSFVWVDKIVDKKGEMRTAEIEDH